MNTGQKDAAAASDIVTINGVKCKPNWDVQTYLFIGEDDRGVKTRKTESDGTGQSDVLELLVIDTKKNTYHKLPINRDTVLILPQRRHRLRLHMRMVMEWN